MEKLSKFVSIIKVDDSTYCLSHSILQKQVFGDKRLKEIYTVLRKPKASLIINQELTKLIEVLRKEGFIDVNNNDSKLIAELYEKNSTKLVNGKPNYTLLRILLTDVCNLKCAYCKVMPNIVDIRKQAVSEENLEKVIKLFFENSNEITPKVIHISGGEPSVVWNRVTFIVDTVNRYKRLNEKYYVCLGTNSLLLDEGKIQYLKDNAVKVIVSMDGMKKSHDKLRLRHDGSGSFDFVHKKLLMLNEKSIDLGISMVIGNHNIRTLGKDIKYIIDTYKPISLGINLMKAPTKEKKNFNQLITPKTYVKKVYEVYKNNRNSGVFMELLYRKLEPFVTKEFRFHDCGATAGRTINIDVLGNIGPCKSFLILNKISGSLSKNIDPQVLAKLVKRSPIYYEKCQNCPAFGICGNGCSYDAWVNTGNEMNIDIHACEYSRLFYREFVKDLYQLNRDKIDGKDYYIATERDRKKLFGNITINRLNLNSSIGHINGD
jgi:uncharacterized protein